MFKFSQNQSQPAAHAPEQESIKGTHFLGKLPYRDYLSVLQISSAHVYLTYPFVLSWSLLEAMACGCRIIASDTAPVREVIEDGVHGALVDFFDTSALYTQLKGALLNDASDLKKKAFERTRNTYCCEVASSKYEAAIHDGMLIREMY
ncbi:glycosyltransferase [Jeongeupia wiesaeckerbachi]|uniref:glycosyltransferase n=1 Tax=Jeongeupia wiesaeckerbachi TaxID=3051218 RepID=UPI003D804542